MTIRALHNPIKVNCHKRIGQRPILKSLPKSPMKAVNCMKRRTISPKNRLSLFQSANGHCQSCQAEIHPGQKWELDHIIPLALGGPDTNENLQILCKICHKFKTANQDRATIAKTKRINLKHLGAQAPSNKSALPCGKNSKWKKKLDGKIVKREQ